MDDRFAAALRSIDRGDAPSLSRLLAAQPDLVHARASGADPPYDGYFHGATLLHHVAGNPVRGPLPTCVVDVTRALLDAGADIDAQCGGGPGQPETGGGTLLGLAATSGALAQSGQAPELLDLLLERGAELNRAGGSILEACLYHTVECQAQREVGEHLRKRGAAVDLQAAAALGELDTLARMLPSDGSLAPDACALRPDTRGWSREQAAQEALVYACMNGRTEAASFLLARGATLDGFAPVARWQLTALHGAAWGGWVETARRLVEQGADATLADPVEGATAIGWAAHCGRTEALAYLAVHARLSLADALVHGSDARALAALADIEDPNMGFADTSPGVLLRTAAFLGRAPLVEALLARGADPDLAGEAGKTARDLARAGGHAEILRLFGE